ncbi:Uncharacterized protein PRO82_000183 [Candidatus Protochlamydia amoebophila]|uniref:hypothetical protein n=1 Tax=Candidatus Protochlamydia amoebophila TaxID=362787 RepID=UPI001BC93385|nr:hypothetical protein [Candidatus Protochlamydia amoebophila]MBS4162905.1 Uncharacterized protein [Candidatus Protochlamydia amoebophila]
MCSKNQLMKILTVLSSFTLVTTAEATVSKPVNSSTLANSNSRVDAKYEIMRRNEIDNTDVLAIPLDDSEVEDQEEINQIEKKEVFALPHSR